MKKTSIAALLLSILLFCFLSGCAGLLKNERMDREVESLIAALNEDDADQIFEAMYPNVVTREEFDEGYEEIRQLWEAADSYTIKLASISTKKNISTSGESVIRQAEYYVYTPNNSYTFTLAHLSNAGGAGLYHFNLNIGAEPVLISGGFTTAEANSVLQWIVLLLSVLSYIFVLVTEIDILRKRPRLFGLWLVAALAFFCFQVQISPENFRIAGGVNFFALSAFKIYSTGARNFVLSLPIGAIAYWLLRRKLLAQKKQAFIQNGPSAPV